MVFKPPCRVRIDVTRSFYNVAGLVNSVCFPYIFHTNRGFPVQHMQEADIRGRITRDGIRIYDDQDFSGMRAAGRLAAEAEPEG